MSGWQVDVEVLLLRLARGGHLAHRWVRGPVAAGTSPDDCAVELAGCEQGVCHSTSWRRERSGALVLTYAVLPDPCPDAPAEPLVGPIVVSGVGVLRPTPAALEQAHVAAHAVRHLADLAHRDPVVRARAREDAALWAAVARTARQAQHRSAEAS